MRILYANCSVDYEGRGSTRLDAYDRVIMIKDDNSVLIHNDKGIKPLNYMTGVRSEFSQQNTETGEEIITFDSNKESLRITIHNLHSEISFVPPHEEDNGLQRDGTEEQLQEWLSENLHTLIPDYTYITREFQTGAGPVDLLAQHNDTSKLLLIEVKRVATRSAVYQVKRYWDEYNENTNNKTKAEAMIIALDVRPSAREFAEKKGINWLSLNWGKNITPSIKSSSFSQLSLTQ